MNSMREDYDYVKAVCASTFAEIFSKVQSCINNKKNNK